MKFQFTSKIAKVILWCTLIFVLLLDGVSVVTLVQNQGTVSGMTFILVVIGISLKLAILYFLIIESGPLQLFTYVWGGLFAISGSFGLLAIFLSEEVEPLQAYLDMAIYLALGIVLIVIVAKYVSSAEVPEN